MVMEHLKASVQKRMPAYQQQVHVMSNQWPVGFPQSEAVCTAEQQQRRDGSNPVTRSQQGRCLQCLPGLEGEGGSFGCR